MPLSEVEDGVGTGVASSEVEDGVGTGVTSSEVDEGVGVGGCKMSLVNDPMMLVTGGMIPPPALDDVDGVGADIDSEDDEGVGSGVGPGLVSVFDESLVVGTLVGSSLAVTEVGSSKEVM
jgi:hypothetical protein